mmetsp:Transcript_25780/g.71023  ORF Transcript_25780/g.71023 Transcript_25780/m.71023 type:complete len:96 (-) Transcript_25780:89-376(-)
MIIKTPKDAASLRWRVVDLLAWLVGLFLLQLYYSSKLLDLDLSSSGLVVRGSWETLTHAWVLAELDRWKNLALLLHANPAALLASNPPLCPSTAN